MSSPREREKLVIYYSSVRCTKDLDLNVYYKDIGMYLNHAERVLNGTSNCSFLSSKELLIHYTLEVLKQIVAPAMSLLWKRHIAIAGSAEETSNCLNTLKHIIDHKRPSTLDYLLQIIMHLDELPRTTHGNKIISFTPQKTELLLRGHWPSNELWSAFEGRFILTISEIREQLGCSYFGDVKILINLLKSYYSALNSLGMDCEIGEFEQRQQHLKTICEYLELLPAWTKRCRFGAELQEAIMRYGCVQ